MFIKVTDINGKEILLNMNYVICIKELDDRVYGVHLSNDEEYFRITKESFEKIFVSFGK
jgi:uncharacterized protein YlzI (FlbEa/FlbD family)